LPASINSLAIHQPKIVYDTLFEATWETLQQFGKKQGSTNGNDSRFAHLAAIELASSLALHCPGRRSGQRGAMENSRSNGKFLFPVKALSKVLERSFMKNSKQSL
jgi:hypothetical protein